MLDFLAADQIAGALHQHAQDLKGLFLEKDFARPLVQFATLGVQLKDPKPNPVKRRYCHGANTIEKAGKVYH